MHFYSSVTVWKSLFKVQVFDV